jgi:hypothetical protein
MDAVYVSRNVTPFAATAGVKTILKLIAGAAFNVKIHEIKISTDGVTATAVPMTVDWGTSDETTAGTTGGTNKTTQIKGTAVAHGTTLGSNFTAEGTTYDIVDGIYVPQFMGLVVIQSPLGLEQVSPGGAVADSFLVRVNVTANVNVFCSIKWSRA